MNAKQKLRSLIKQEIANIAKNPLTEGAHSVMMNDPTVRNKVERAIATLRKLDIDGETMEYIIDQLAMTDQMIHQLKGKTPSWQSKR